MPFFSRADPHVVGAGFSREWSICALMSGEWNADTSYMAIADSMISESDDLLYSARQRSSNLARVWRAPHRQGGVLFLLAVVLASTGAGVTVTTLDPAPVRFGRAAALVS